MWDYKVHQVMGFNWFYKQISSISTFPTYQMSLHHHQCLSAAWENSIFPPITHDSQQCNHAKCCKTSSIVKCQSIVKLWLCNYVLLSKCSFCRYWSPALCVACTLAWRCLRCSRRSFFSFCASWAGWCINGNHDKDFDYFDLMLFSQQGMVL